MESTSALEMDVVLEVGLCNLRAGGGWVDGEMVCCIYVTVVVHEVGTVIGSCSGRSSVAMLVVDNAPTTLVVVSSLLRA